MPTPPLRSTAWPTGNGMPRATRPTPHVVVCVHGLSRQGRDFDTFGAQPECPARVICPDVVGRGQSDWLVDPGLSLPRLRCRHAGLLAQVHQQAPITTLDWVGTSMGGLIGMAVAGQPGLPLPAPVRRLVLNDVGPVIQWEALQRIGQYLGYPARFDSLQQAADAMWAISTSFGPHTQQQWLELSRPMLRSLPDGGLTLHYDPAIAVPFRALTQEAAAAGESVLWQLYDQIQAQRCCCAGRSPTCCRAKQPRPCRPVGPRRVVWSLKVGHAPP